MNQDRFVTSGEAIPALNDLNAAVGLLWASAAAAAPDQYPGFEVTHDGERAAFKMTHSPTTYDQVALYRDEDGVWCVEEQRQRPTLETEGFGHFSRTTTTHTLMPGERGTRLVEMSGPHTEGEFTPQSFGALPMGLDGEGCERILGILRTIRGEQEMPSGSTPQRRWNVLRWLGLRTRSVVE